MEFDRAHALSSFFPSTTITRIFLGVTLVESIVDITIVAILLNSFNDGLINIVNARDSSSVLPVYLGLFVLAHLFQFMIAVDAIRAKNMIQILGLCVFNTLFLAYSIVQILDLRSLVDFQTNFFLVIPIMIGVTEIVYLASLYQIYLEFGWNIYRQLGADRNIKKMYLHYQVFICLLKFDFFFFISFSLQLVLLVLHQIDAERWITIATAPVTFIVLLMGYFAVKREKVFLAWSFLISCIVGAGYFIFKLIRISQNRTTDYALVFKSLTVFATLCLAALIITFAFGVICTLNFGGGLKYAMESKGVIPEFNDSKVSLSDSSFMMKRANPSRMSMD